MDKEQDEALKRIRRNRYANLTDREWDAICDHLDTESYDLTSESDQSDFCESVDRLLPVLEAAKASIGGHPTSEGLVSLRNQGGGGHYGKAIRRRHRIHMFRCGLLLYRDALKATGRPPIRITWDESARRYNEFFNPAKPISGDAFKHAFYRGRDESRAMAWEDRSVMVFQELSELHEKGLMCNGVSWICLARQQMADGTFRCEILDETLHPYAGCIYLNELVRQREEEPA